MKKLKIGKVNQVWASDITYVAMPRGYIYLYVVIDLYSRFIVKWGLSNNMSADWCVTITKEAFQNWGKPEIFNTDQGHNLLQTTLWTYLKNLKYNKVWMGKESH